MSDLERDLRALGSALVFAPTPDLASAVGRELAPRAPRPWRRLVPVGVAILALAIGVTMAVPPARTAVLRFFGVGAVHIRFVDRLPLVQQRSAVPIGRELPESEWPRLVRSPLLGGPDAVYAYGGTITQVFGAPGDVRLLLTTIPYSAHAPDVAKKLAGVEGTSATWVVVPGSAEPALWIAGQKHVVRFPGWPPRLAGNTLVWVQDGITNRIEGALARGEAIRIARSLH